MTKTGMLILTALVSTAAAAQGSFDFSRIEGLPAEPTVQIDLPPEMLGFVAEAARASDPGSAEALADIRNVRVRVYEDLTQTAPLLESIEQASQMLETEGWQRMVYVNDGEDKVRLYVKPGGQNLAGMTVMVLGASEAVFVNVDGSIEPATLGRLATQFGMGGMLDGVTGLGAGLPAAGGGAGAGAGAVAGGGAEAGAGAAAGSGPGPDPAPGAEDTE